MRPADALRQMRPADARVGIWKALPRKSFRLTGTRRPATLWSRLPDRRSSIRRARLSAETADDAPTTGYIDSGAEIPSSVNALASVIRAAPASANRAAERAGSSGSTTRASR